MAINTLISDCFNFSALLFYYTKLHTRKTVPYEILNHYRFYGVYVISYEGQESHFLSIIYYAQGLIHWLLFL